LCKARILSRHEEAAEWVISVNYTNLPVVAVIFLLAIRAIHGETVRKGIVGGEGIHPFDIMALFICLVCHLLAN
jgi:hypothetical protein